MENFALPPIETEKVGSLIREHKILEIPATLIEELHIVFAGLNGYHPSRLKMEIPEGSLHHMNQQLMNHYTIPGENIFTSFLSEGQDRKLKLLQLLVFIKKDLACYLTDGDLEIYYTNGMYTDFLDAMKKIAAFEFEKLKTETEQFQLVISKEKGYSLKRFRLKPFNISIEDNYNDDFQDVHKKIMNALSAANHKGMILLHGEPGTGKTTYIRYLARNLTKKIIFIPPEFSFNLDADTFLRLMSRYPDSVVIIEDADNIITDRKAGNNISISGLLNIADGLLSYYLKSRIICTFNCNLASIDPALMRKGRLIAMYEFKKLKANKAQKLVKKLKIPLEVGEDTSLADIYGYEDIASGYTDQRIMGFRKR